jgi:hypothetical protein
MSLAPADAIPAYFIERKNPAYVVGADVRRKAVTTLALAPLRRRLQFRNILANANLTTFEQRRPNRS